MELIVELFSPVDFFFFFLPSFLPFFRNIIKVEERFPTFHFKILFEHSPSLEVC